MILFRVDQCPPHGGNMRSLVANKSSIRQVQFLISSVSYKIIISEVLYMISPLYDMFNILQIWYMEAISVHDTAEL
jgi:hypothetical protein